MTDLFSYTSILPYFVVMSLIVILSVYFVKKNSFYRNIAKAESSERYEALDGLRGFLALGVFFQHAIQNLSFFQTGIWRITDVKFYRFLGGEAVILFFITTSFLYWLKVIASKGNFDMLRLYKSRMLRLIPLYLFSACVVSIIALYNTRFDIVSVSGFFRDIFYWLTQGLKTITTFNGFDIIPVNAGIHWTMKYEWSFYLILPIIALLLRNTVGKIVSILILLGIFLLPDRGYWSIFLFGIMAAYIVSYVPAISWFKKNPWSTLVPFMGILIVYFIDYNPYGYVQYAISLVIFLSFVYGNTLFGFLKIPAVKFLSTISYSMYLLHGIVLYLVLHGIDYIYPIWALSPIMFWFVILLCAVLVILTSSLSYRYIEHPFIRKIEARRKGKSVPEIVDRVV